jgi:hypothetical protein
MRDNSGANNSGANVTGANGRGTLPQFPGGERAEGEMAAPQSPWHARVGDWIGRHPGVSLGVALGVGVLVGWIVKRK